MILLVSTNVFAAPQLIYQTGMMPITDNRYDLGTTSLRWRNLYVQTASTTELTISSINGSTQCLQVSASGVVSGTGGSCGGAGGTPNWKQITIDSIQVLTPTTTTVHVRIASTTVEGSFNTGTLTATSGTSWINALSLGTVLSVGNGGTGQATFSAGQLLYGSAANGISTVATGTVSGTNGITVTAGRSAIGGSLAIDCSVASGSVAGCLSTADWNTFNSKAGFAYPFIDNATTTALTLSTTTISGSLNTGTLTATSGTSWINALALGTALADSYISSASTWNAKYGGTNNWKQITWGTEQVLTPTTTVNLLVGSSTIQGKATVGFLTATSTTESTLTGGFLSSASSTINADNITLGGSATATKDFTVLGKFAQKLGSSTASMTGTTLIDFNALGTHQTWINTGATNLIMNSTSSNPIAGMTFIISICNAPTGSGAVTFSTPGELRWDGGENATTSIPTTANKQMSFGGWYDGSRYHIVASSTLNTCF